MNNIQLFDLRETNVSSYEDIRRYEDIFNCRIMLIDFDPSADNIRKNKFSNMDYPVLYENLKTQMLNKKFKMEKMKAKLKKKNSDYLDDNFISSNPTSRKTSFLRQNSSPLSALENTIKENQRLDFNNVNNAVIDSSDDSSTIISDEEEGETFENLMATRSHRVSFTHAEEQKRLSMHAASDSNISESRRVYQQTDYSQQRFKSYNQFLDIRNDEPLYNIQLDFKAFQKSPTYNKYKAEIIKNNLIKKKEPKLLIDQSNEFTDKSIFTEKRFDELDLDDNIALDNQSMNFSVMNVSRKNILENSTSSLQRLQILQTDIFMFELKDCCAFKEEAYIDNDYENSEDASLENILFEFEQLISLIYEIVDPSSQNIESSLFFCCCCCNNHVDNDTNISGGYIKSINPKLLKFFENLGINYKTNFFPVSRAKNDIIYRHEENDDLFNQGKFEDSKNTSLVYNNNYPAIRKQNNVSHVLATVSHDTGRLRVKSFEETLYGLGRKSIITKTDVLYQKMPKIVKNVEDTSVYEGSHSSISLKNAEGKQTPLTLQKDAIDNNSNSNTQSSFFVSKDVRASTNRSPPLVSPAFQNNIMFNTESNRDTENDDNQPYTPVTNTPFAEKNFPESHMLSLMNKNNTPTTVDTKENTETKQKVISDVDTTKIVASLSRTKSTPNRSTKNNTCCVVM
ncbi:uncharacterized protein HGUI_02920 [Hanseniaspora guilliermondii]|uniref:Uncharacterized protein n=1 Tax=Hanseniaspora guilliermondii TaxID=56406 RepID=A0A1L0B2M6_9ASCO|nr:uncharacterized protein HGUI_02920 [Hanseniaspora guilliermondii]